MAPSRMRIASIALACSVLLPAVHARAGDTGTIIGSIREQALDRPIGQVSVSIIAASGVVVQEAETDAEGDYTSGPLAAGVYFALAHKAGFDPQRFDRLPCTQTACDPLAGTPIAVAEGAATTGIDFQLARVGGALPVPPLVYVNRCVGGCMVSPGPDSAILNRSSLVSSVRTISPYSHGDAAFASVMRCIRTTFAPFHVELTSTDPGAVPHRELMLAGTPQQAGFPGTVGGVAPWQCGVPLDNAIAFAFVQPLATTDLVGQCEIATHELGHLFGLDHESLARDTMSYSPALPELRRFVDEPSTCGVGAPEPCYCGSPVATQNTYRKLRTVAGVDRVFAGTFGDPEFPLPSGHLPATAGLHGLTCGTQTRTATPPAGAGPGPGFD